MASSKFSIIEATIIFTRTTGADIEVDVKPSVLEFRTYENITKAYVDASIVFVDDFGLRDSLTAQGTERIRIVIGNPNDPEELSISKTFFFAKITDSKKEAERGEILAIDLVEEHVFINAVKSISRSFSSNIETIIETLMFNELGKEVERSDFTNSAQGTRKIVVPYMSPLEAVNWIKDRATTKLGSPIYLRASLFSNKLLLSDFDSLMQREAINAKFPFRYTIAGKSTDQEELRPYFEIIDYKELDANDLMMQYEEGNIGSYFATLDAGTGIESGKHVSVREIIDEFYVNNIISAESVQSLYDDTLIIGDKLSDDYDALHIFQVTSSNTYNQFLSYHDETVLLDDQDRIIESKLKVRNKIIRAMIKKNMLDVGLDGRLFLEANINTGTKLRMIFLNSNSQADTLDVNNQIDKRKSGDYFILAISHLFTGEKHNVVVRLSKLGELPKNFAL